MLLLWKLVFGFKPLMLCNRLVFRGFEFSSALFEAFEKGCMDQAACLSQVSRALPSRFIPSRSPVSPADRVPTAEQLGPFRHWRSC